MASSKTVKSCLIITFGPVPTPQYQTVEGGGMRAWGLAKGLTANGVSVTVAINDSFPQKSKKHEGVRLVNWSLDRRFSDLINSYDSVIISYCMGDPSIFVAKNLNDGVQLILDVYVPIYVEVSARDSKDIANEYTNYMRDVEGYNLVLERGDYFLCASESQKIYYTGVLGALGIINPRSYREDRVLIAPFGIHNQPAVAKYNPYKKLGIGEDQFIVLWFGGLYPWFRVEEFTETIRQFADSKQIKFVIVGGKNPFNNNPDFVRQYEKVYKFAIESKLLDKALYLVDWVDYEDRINWYKHADVVISLNQPGDENIFSWRTRVMDYVWGEVPVITNGGDPLSNYLIASNSALKVDELSSKSIINIIESMVKDLTVAETLRKNLINLKPEFYWDKIVIPILKVITESTRPYITEKQFKTSLISGGQIKTGNGRLSFGLNNNVRAVARYVRYAKQKGIKKSFTAGRRVIGMQLKTHLTRPPGKRYIFISHPLNNTGAPQVLLQIIKDYTKVHGPENIQLLAPSILPEQLRLLREKGVTVDKAAAGLGGKLMTLQMGLKKNDFVLMNTAAIYDNYFRYVIDCLETGKLQHAYWFIHEDRAQLPGVNPGLLDKNLQKSLRVLITAGRLTILVPSARTKKEYDELLKVKAVKVIELRVDVPNIYKQPRAVKDYDEVNFLLQGTPSDGRKGQLIALPAFYEFIEKYQKKNPEKYRKFKLHLVAIGNDYISQQVRWVGESLLGKQAVFYPSLPYNESLEITAKCNSVICCSLNETFCLSVAEGMLMNHFILRNNSAGVDEQLKDGVNGYLIDHTNINSFADVIEKVLNKEKTPSDKLHKMGRQSQKIIKKFQEHSYLGQIDKKKPKTI